MAPEADVWDILQLDEGRPEPQRKERIRVFFLSAADVTESSRGAARRRGGSNSVGDLRGCWFVRKNIIIAKAD